MPQFTVHRNQNTATRSRYPLLLDVQSDLLGPLGTTVVIPLTPASAAARRSALKTLMPVCQVDGKGYVLATPMLAGIARRELGPAVTSLAGERQAIVAALDLLLTGI